ncbi:hypothetical protein NEPAR06_1840 [Nematocida parisii]|eukprot:XP_013059263.1 hypothetical protein NEPG_01435 [Nematocida parisii ERTm1]
MDSEEQRSAVMHNERYSEKPYNAARKDHSYENKKPAYKSQFRTDTKKAEIDKKKKKKREESATDKEDILISGLPKRENKGFQLVLQDGSQITAQLIQEELKKYQSASGTAAVSEEPNVESAEPEKSEKEETISEPTKAVESESVKEEALSGEKAEVVEPVAPVPEKPKLSPLEEMKMQLDRHLEEERKKKAMEAAAALDVRSEESSKAETAQPEVSAPEKPLSTVAEKPVEPVKEDSEEEEEDEEPTGPDVNIWTRKKSKNLLNTIFNKVPEKKSPAKAPAFRTARKVSTLGKATAPAAQGPTLTIEKPEKTFKEKGEGVFRQDKLAKGIGKMKISSDSASRTPKEEPYKKAEAAPSAGTKTISSAGANKPESAAVTVSEKIHLQERAETTPQTIAATASTKKAEPISFAAVDKAVSSPDSFYKSLDGATITSLPIIYSKEQLWALKSRSEGMPSIIDKNILAKSIGAGKKRKDFKMFKTSGFKDARKTALPVTVFESIEPYIAEFNLALNQVCQNNIDEVAKRILSIKVPTVEAMEELAKAFFNRAMVEHAYTGVYAALVERLEVRFRAQTEEPFVENSPTGYKTVFRRTIIKLSQQEFMVKRTWATDQVEHKMVSMTAEELAKRVMEISSNKEKEYERISIKKRALTIARFAVELYLQLVLKDSTMHSSIFFIMEDRTPENVEIVCYILKHAGSRLDVPIAKEYMDSYITWLKESSANLSVRYKFMVEEIIDLRKHSWVAKDSRKDSEDEDDGWKSSKTKEKKKFVKEKSVRKESISKTQKVSEFIELHDDEYRKMESDAVSTLKCSNKTFAPAEHAKRLSVEYNSLSAIFFTALIKITIEGYGDTLENGMGLVKEWTKLVPLSPQKKEEVFEYIEEIMPDLVDDSPKAPAHFEEIKKALHK